MKDKSKYYINNAKLTVKDYFKSKDQVKYFIGLMIFFWIVYFIFSLIKGQLHLTSIFFCDGDDTFMDFFNSVRDVSQGAGVYTERGVIYPPMANFIFSIFLRFTPKEYAATSDYDRYTWINYPTNLIVCFCFLSILLIIFLLVFRHNYPRDDQTKTWLAFLLIFNAPMLYLLERGNIVLLSTALCAIYFFSFDSNKKWVREFGLISLAFAFSLKLYPAIFGWLLISNKRYKEAIRCIVYALLFLLIPSFFFGGPICIVWMIQNVFKFSVDKSAEAPSFFDNINKIISISQNLINLIEKIYFVLVIFALILFLVGSFFIKESWKKVLLACVAFNALPPVTSLYNWVIFIVPLFLFMKEAKLEKRNWLYFFAISIPFMILPEFLRLERWGLRATVNSLIIYPCIMFIIVLLTIDTTIEIIKFFKNKKSSQVQQVPVEAENK